MGDSMRDLVGDDGLGVDDVERLAKKVGEAMDKERLDEARDAISEGIESVRGRIPEDARRQIDDHMDEINDVIKSVRDRNRKGTQD
jgi:chaperonin cofactor prefoldin